MARIIPIEHWDRDVLFVPGTDPEQIIADGNAYLARNPNNEYDEDAVITTPPDEIRIGWYRVNPCKPGVNCGDYHCGHWVDTPERTRGGFQGAMVTVGCRSEVTV
jgi:hypothetical protein